MEIKILFMTVLIATCGRYSEQNKAPSDPSKWDKIKSIVKAECVRCHDGIIRASNFNSEEAFVASKAQARIENASMPPDKKLDEKAKALLLDYFPRNWINKDEEICKRSQCL